MEQKPKEVSEDTARRYFLHLVERNGEAINSMIALLPPEELLPVIAYLVAILETQVEHAGDDFDQLRSVFSAYYPGLVAAVEEKQGKPEADGIVVIIPRIDGPVLNPFTDTVEQLPSLLVS